MNKDTIKSIASMLGLTLGKIGGYFLWSISFYYAYEWFSWNFNLPPMTYLNVVAILSSCDIALNTIIKKFIKPLDK